MIPYITFYTYRASERGSTFNFVYLNSHTEDIICIQWLCLWLVSKKYMQAGTRHSNLLFGQFVMWSSSSTTMIILSLDSPRPLPPCCTAVGFVFAVMRGVEGLLIQSALSLGILGSVYPLSSTRRIFIHNNTITGSIVWGQFQYFHGEPGTHKFLPTRALCRLARVWSKAGTHNLTAIQ